MESGVAEFPLSRGGNCETEGIETEGMSPHKKSAPEWERLTLEFRTCRPAVGILARLMVLRPSASLRPEVDYFEAGVDWT